jgi:hypothetical protein
MAYCLNWMLALRTPTQMSERPLHRKREELIAELLGDVQLCSNASEQSGRASRPPQQRVNQATAQWQVDGMVAKLHAETANASHRTEQAAKTLVGQQSETFKRPQRRCKSAVEGRLEKKPPRLPFAVLLASVGCLGNVGDPMAAFSRLMPAKPTPDKGQ